MKNNQERGFLTLIIAIVVALLLLSYFHVSISQVFNWCVNTFHTIFK